MSEQNNNLLQLFSKLLWSPRFIKAIRMERMRQKLQDRNSRSGAQGLFILLWTEDGLTNAEIAEKLDIRPSSVTAQVKNLEERGFVTRVSDENDKRVSRVFLTEAGKAAKDKRHERHESLSEELFGVLSEEEQIQLQSILEKLNQKNEEDAKKDAPDWFQSFMTDEQLENLRHHHDWHRSVNDMRKEARKMQSEFRHQMRNSHDLSDFGNFGPGSGLGPNKPKADKDENWDDF